MEREQIPDHEGYIAFKKALAEKDSDMFIRALYAPQGTALDQYMRLHAAESIARHYAVEPVGEIVLRRQREKVSEISSYQARQRASGLIQRALAGWDAERRRYDRSHREHSADDITAEMNRRQAEHPRETRSQSVFQAMLAVKEKYAHGLGERRDEIAHDVAEIVEKAVSRERAPQMGDPGYAQWREQQKSRGRER